VKEMRVVCHRTINLSKSPIMWEELEIVRKGKRIQKNLLCCNVFSCELHGLQDEFDGSVSVFCWWIQNESVELRPVDTQYRGGISRSKVAEVCVTALVIPESSEKIVEIVAGSGRTRQSTEDQFAAI
jgi:hypothetical protein